MTIAKRLPAICFCFIITSCIHAQIKLPQIIRDSMILQRDIKINMWGWASKGEKVSVQFNNKTYRTTTNDSGKWMLQLPSMKAGGPYTMNISGKNKIVLHDILIGDVWVVRRSIKHGTSNEIASVLIMRMKLPMPIMLR